MPTGNRIEVDAYSDDSAFVRLLETKGRVRVLDVFLRKPRTELTAEQVANLAGINPSTFSRNKGVLEELDILSKSLDDDGNIQYRLNIDNDIVQILGRAHTELMKFSPELAERTEVNRERYIGELFTSEVASKTENREEGIQMVENLVEKKSGS